MSLCSFNNLTISINTEESMVELGDDNRITGIYGQLLEYLFVSKGKR